MHDLETIGKHIYFKATSVFCSACFQESKAYPLKETTTNKNHYQILLLIMYFYIRHIFSFWATVVLNNTGMKHSYGTSTIVSGLMKTNLNEMEQLVITYLLSYNYFVIIPT